MRRRRLQVLQFGNPFATGRSSVAAAAGKPAAALRLRQVGDGALDEPCFGRLKGLLILGTACSRALL